MKKFAALFVALLMPLLFMTPAKSTTYQYAQVDFAREWGDSNSIRIPRSGDHLGFKNQKPDGDAWIRVSAVSCKEINNKWTTIEIQLWRHKTLLPDEKIGASRWWACNEDAKKFHWGNLNKAAYFYRVLVERPHIEWCKDQCNIWGWYAWFWVDDKWEDIAMGEGIAPSQPDNNEGDPVTGDSKFIDPAINEDAVVK